MQLMQRPIPRREVYQLTNTNPSFSISLDFKPASLQINNFSKYPCYVRIGGVDKPDKLSFTDIIGPYSSYVADPAGAIAFAVNVDNSTDPLSAFAYPVTIAFSTGAASVQSPLSAQLTNSANSAYISKILQVEFNSLLDMWILNENPIVDGGTAVDQVSTLRNGAYHGTPTPQAALLPDGQTKVPFFNGSNQYVNIISTSLAGVFNPALGSMLCWVQMPSAQWSSAGAAAFWEIAGSGINGLELLQNGVNTLQFFYVNTTLSVTITPTSSFVPIVATWNKALNRIRLYWNGAQIGADTAIPNTWSGSVLNATIGSALGFAVIPGSIGAVTLWSTELTASEALLVSSAP